MHRLYYDLTRNMRREHMCDDSGYVQDERATACLLIRYVLSRRHALQTEMPPIPAHCCPGKSKFGATLGAGPVRPLISMTEHRKNTPRFPPSNLHSMHANLHQMVSSARKSRRQYVSLRGTMSRSPRCSFSCRSATWICEEGKVSGVRQRCIWCLEYSTRLHAKIAAFHSSSSGSHASSKTGGHHHITETSLTADTSEVPRSNCCSDTASGSG